MTLSPFQPWLITPDACHELIQLASAPPAPSPPIPPSDKTGVSIKDGLATVALHGTMLRVIPPALRAKAALYGVRLCGMEETGEALRQIAREPSVHTVLLDMDSPGGTVNGTPELGEAVRALAATRHVYAYTAGQCCSAAYWVASQCDAIYAAPSACVGSIGVILPLLDSSALYDKNGLKLEVFSAGKYKGIGLAGCSLTEEQRALLTQKVQTIWAEFRQAVTCRREIAPADMEGQSFYGQEAWKKGLVDANCTDVSQLQAKLLCRHVL